MLGSQVAREYRTKHGEKVSNHALARIMYKENKMLFRNVEGARSALRYIEGKCGIKSKNKIKDKSLVIDEPRPLNPYALPKSDETEYLPFILKGHKKVAILNDIHAPYHNIEAITTALQQCKKEKVDAVVLTEMFDFHGGSKYMRDPRKRNMASELEIGCEIFKIIHKVLKVPIYYKLGNHCERWMHYLWQKFREIDELKDLQELEELNFHAVLKRRLKGVPIEIIDDKRIIKLNALNVVHGHEFGGSIFSPVNIARGFYLRAKANTIGGHHHRTSEHTEQNINQEIITTWSTGCLCELHPAYLPINSWNHGFAIVVLEGTKIFNVKNYRINKGKIL